MTMPELTIMREALRELADSGELLREVEAHLREAADPAEEVAALEVHQRYEAALVQARRLVAS